MSESDKKKTNWLSVILLAACPPLWVGNEIRKALQKPKQEPPAESGDSDTK